MELKYEVQLQQRLEEIEEVKCNLNFASLAASKPLKTKLATLDSEVR